MAPIKLSKQSLAELRAAQRQLHDLLAEFDKLESCGIDCQEFRSVHADAMKATEELIKHYGSP